MISRRLLGLPKRPDDGVSLSLAEASVAKQEETSPGYGTIPWQFQVTSERRPGVQAGNTHSVVIQIQRRVHRTYREGYHPPVLP